MKHISAKGFQVGSLVGTLFVAPFIWYRTGTVALEPVLKPMGITALGFTALSTAIGLGLLATKIDREGAEDRSYRLHYNAS